MVLFIAGSSHTGKTLLAQRLLEQHGWPYLSIDLLKMGLIRSGQTALTPGDDAQLTEYLWPIVREIAKTAIENGQNLILEGCYIPFDWQTSFDEAYQKQLRYVCLIMTPDYIASHGRESLSHANDIEHRLDDSSLNLDRLAEENAFNLEQCQKYGCEYILIDGEYKVEVSR